MVITTEYLPVDPDNLPAFEPMVEVFYRSGWEATGHFSPHKGNRCFWEFRGWERKGLTRVKRYRRCMELPVLWRPVS